MNEQAILRGLMQNPAFKNALREMLLHDKDLAAQMGINGGGNVYVWCAEMHDVNGGVFYHPIVTAASGAMVMPSVDEMMDVSNYVMLADEDQFEAYKYEDTVRLFRSVYGSVPVKLIAIPKDTFENLRTALLVLVTNIVGEINKCFDHLNIIAAMSNTKVDMLKMILLASVFGRMSTVAACIDREMNIHDSANHEYVTQGEIDTCDECDECDGCDCRNNCGACDCGLCLGRDDDEDEDDCWDD